MQQVNIPAGVTKVGSRAFLGCINLTEIHFNDGLQSIGQRAFHSCWDLRSVTIPSSVIEVGSGAFYNCSNLAEVHFIEGSLQVIDRETFRGCNALQQVTIPASVTRLGDLAFTNCANLTQVILLGGEHLLNKRFLYRDQGRFNQGGVLNQDRLIEMIGSGSMHCFAFAECPLLATVKISTAKALSQLMSRLPHECRLSIEEKFVTCAVLSLRKMAMS
ncbi:hypothetical protein THAOC_33200 [Thalassiosira oceanica]|uniref:Leucine-rich repeat domain-containing protein n=1 Tax=Thalassiosira oceanica TaxID=159749 RepID=K0R7K3_THAOC|nr:hypothetical protein THAOC_33200 [Thalassiosira oceanica]|eukprot:EJK48039.1 hypothetical protein THAOC_33200 [Thalassiosira oceanica]